MTVEIIIIAFLIILGVGLLAAEVFLLPGITIAGIAGGLMLIGSIAYAFYYIGETAGYITIAANLIISVAAFLFILKSNALSHIALKTDIDATVDQTEILQLNIGQTGITLSRLNPIGKAEFDNQYIVEVKSITGEFIDEGENVQIVKIEKSSVLVQSVPQSENQTSIN
ncbi:NfeD-like partner-binding protein [Dysgonomonas alginatilytica]|uniref:NfeD-like partner-binding protein n=1 Tax=Dysgonomonas alginatilytica TaxID=1605892 RepID=A0A2V3PUD5_9BACT|nr:NfeD family protein [Dysgonomonas alginatilytica]PXV62995.1 NfeD-like partner-binding protein [Dysgonomonas alginatilytica]